MEKEIYFEVTTPLGVRVRTTKEYWDYIVNIKHRPMKNKENIVNPVRKSSTFQRGGSHGALNPMFALKGLRPGRNYIFIPAASSGAF